MALSSQRTTTINVREFLADARERVNIQLNRIAAEAVESLGSPIGDAVLYSLVAPGKRIRPSLTMAVHRELSGSGDIDRLAAAIEVVHTYSLVHDDLPCMDDDDLRRGRPTTHKRFGVAVATEAAYRMVPLAARVLASGAAAAGFNDGDVGRFGRVLFTAAGASGMVGGQVMDLQAAGKRFGHQELVAIHAAKTGALIASAAELGALAAGADRKQVAAARSYGGELGLAFQIVDDILDVTGSSEELGKTAGKDVAQHKATFATMLSEADARRQAEECINRGVDRLGDAGIHSRLLEDLGRFIIDRRS